MYLRITYLYELFSPLIDKLSRIIIKKHLAPPTYSKRGESRDCEVRNDKSVTHSAEQRSMIETLEKGLKGGGTLGKTQDMSVFL
jgi:hypothetical protein